MSARWGRVSFQRCVVQNNRADCGGAVALTDNESVTSTSCFFAGNPVVLGSDILLTCTHPLDIRGRMFGIPTEQTARVAIATEGQTSSR